MPTSLPPLVSCSRTHKGKTFLKLCVDLVGPFHGAQAAADIGLVEPKLHSPNSEMQCGPGPPSALAALVPAYAAWCKEHSGYGVPAPGSLVEDLKRRRAAQPYLVGLCRAIVNEHGVILESACRAVLSAAFGQGAQIVAGDSPVAPRMIGPATLQTWLCEERKLQRDDAVRYIGSGVMDPKHLALLSSGLCTPAMSALLQDGESWRQRCRS